MSLKKNVIANYLGQGWTALMGLAFIPIYIKYLGIEAYGLIGIFALLQAWLSLLDAGMTPTLNREMARFKGGAHNVQSIRDLLRSIEIIAVGIALFIGFSIWLISEWLSSSWLKFEKIPIKTVADALTIMGIITALRLIESIYRSSVIGLQKQVLLNIINSIMATVKWLGAVIILTWVSPTIEAFFLWQGIVSVLTLGAFAYVVYHTLPKTTQRGQFSLSALQDIWRFAGGMIGITFLALLLTQIDKILLSKLLTLERFGYYSLAAIVAGTLYVVITPITQAFFPRFSELIVQENQVALIENYHKSAQMVTVIMGSSAIILIFFSESILYLWTQDLALAQRSSFLVTLLALGNLLNGLMHIPYQMQLAHGWTSLTIKLNIVSVVVIVPAILWATPLYGAEGAAYIWIALNAGYVFIGIHFIYQKILLSEKWFWYLQDVSLPLGTATCIAALFVWAIPTNLSALETIVWLITASITIFTTSFLAASALRPQILYKLPSFIFIRNI